MAYAGRIRRQNRSRKSPRRSCRSSSWNGGRTEAPLTNLLEQADCDRRGDIQRFSGPGHGDAYTVSGEPPSAFGQPGALVAEYPGDRAPEIELVERRSGARFHGNHRAAERVREFIDIDALEDRQEEVRAHAGADDLGRPREHGV